jgi:V8-like Glu-specific endopeptidase
MSQAKLTINKSKSLLSTALVLLSSAATVSLPQMAKAEIIGADDRVVPSYDWMVNNGRQAVGKLETLNQDGRFSNCTFTVVGRNLGLTNTHCIRDAAGRAPRQIKAYALRHGTRTYASANVDLFWTGLSQAPVNGSPISTFSKDWAIIRFSTNLGDITGWMGNEGFYNSVSDAGKTVLGATSTLIGYSGGGDTPTGHFGCRFNNAMTSGVLPHNCDMTGGASGSGLHTSGRRIQGLNWGSFTLNGSPINGSVPLERFMPALQQQRNNGGANVSVPVP